MRVASIDLSAPATLKARAVSDNSETSDTVLTDTDTGVTVTGSIASSITLAVTPKETTAAQKALILTQLGAAGELITKSFDINLLDAIGKEVQPDGHVKVTIPIPDGWDASRTLIYYVNDSVATDMKGVVSADGKYITFVTEPIICRVYLYRYLYRLSVFYYIGNKICYDI